MDDRKHEGCFFCGSVEDEILTSKPIYDITSKIGRALAPHSVAVCSEPVCLSRTKIDYRERQGKVW